MIDHTRIDALRKVLGDSRRDMADEFDAILEYRRMLSQECDQLRTALHSIAALPAWLAPATMAAADPEQATRIMQDPIRDALGDLLATDDEEASHGA